MARTKIEPGANLFEALANSPNHRAAVERILQRTFEGDRVRVRFEAEAGVEERQIYEVALSPAIDACGRIIGVRDSGRMLPLPAESIVTDTASDSPATGSAHPVSSGIVRPLALLRALLDHASMAVAQIDPAGCVVCHNRAFAALLGAPEMAFAGRPLAELIAPTSAALVAMVERVFASNVAVEPAEMAWAQSACPAGMRWVRASVFPVAPHPLGPPEFAGVLLHDITAHRRIEHSLQRMNHALRHGLATYALDAERQASQIRRLAMELAKSKQAERQRLAQVIHDHLQQLLVAAKVKLDVATKHLSAGPDGSNFRGILDSVINLLDESIAVARDLTVELHPPMLADGGLSAAVRWLADWMLNNHELAVDVRDGTGTMNLPEETGAFVFQCVRELLFNVAKHSGEKRATVSLMNAGADWLHVEVRDDGRGFDPGLSPAGFGTFSMRERLTEIGGEMQVHSAPGYGAQIILRVPVSPTVPPGATPGD